VFDEVFEAAEALGRELSGPVIRLRERPEATAGSDTIYRYDREALMAALTSAARFAHRPGGRA